MHKLFDIGPLDFDGHRFTRGGQNGLVYLAERSGSNRKAIVFRMEL